jgi:transposase
MITFTGLDVHKRVVGACVLDEGGTIVQRQLLDLMTEQLVAFAQEQIGPEGKMVVEATTNTWAAVRIRKPHCGEVVVSNPLQTKAIAQAKVRTEVARRQRGQGLAPLGTPWAARRARWSKPAEPD